VNNITFLKHEAPSRSAQRPQPVVVSCSYSMGPSLAFHSRQPPAMEAMFV